MSVVDSSFQLVMVKGSDFLSEQENKVISDLAELCSSVVRDKVDSPKKKYIRETVDHLSRRLLHKNLDPNQ